MWIEHETTAAQGKFYLTDHEEVFTGRAARRGALWYTGKSGQAGVVVCRKAEQVCTLKDGIRTLGLAVEGQEKVLWQRNKKYDLFLTQAGLFVGR